MHTLRQLAIVLIAGLGLARGDTFSTDYVQYNNGSHGHRPYQRFRTTDQFGPLLQVTTWNKTGTIETSASSASISHNGGSHIFMRHEGHDEIVVSRALRPPRPGGQQLGFHRKPNPITTLTAPVILDANDLSLVYVNRSFLSVFGARVQEDRGKRYFTFWGGRNIGGFGDGFGLVYDDTYRLVYNVTADNPNHVDLHEFALTGNGTALVAAVEWLPVNSLLSNWTSLDDHQHLSGARLLDSRFQEIDLATNKVLFDWRATEHIDPADSMAGRGNAWDPYHINSVQKTTAGNYLVSLRHLHSIILIDGKTGDILWTLGGKRNMFTELPVPAGSPAPMRRLLPNEFRWQHHAHYVPGTNETQLTFFDNYVIHSTQGRCEQDCSRAVRLAIDSNPKSGPPTVQLLSEYTHPARIQTQSQGSAQILYSETSPSTENIFVGWGHCPGFTEHNVATGEIMLDVQFGPWQAGGFPDAPDNYRAYKLDWVATPYWDPVLVLEHFDVAVADDKDAAAASASEGKDGKKAAAAAAAATTVKTTFAYVSWNGATEVKSWTIRAGPTADTNQGGVILARSPRTGFETTLEYRAALAGDYRFVWAEALDKDGTVLRRSPAVDLTMPATVTVGGYHLTKKKLVAGVSVGSALVVAAVIGGVWLWRRRAGYSRLQGSDGDESRDSDDDIELDAERDKAVNRPSSDAMHVIGSDSENDDDADKGVDSDSDDGNEMGESVPLKR